MQSVIKTISPANCSAIVDGYCNSLISRTAPKGGVPFRVWMHVSKDKLQHLQKLDNGSYLLWGNPINGALSDGPGKDCNGTVFGEFVCDKVYRFVPHWDGYRIMETNKEIIYDGRDISLGSQDIYDVLHDGGGFLWHISEVRFYSEPKPREAFKIQSCRGCIGKDTLPCLFSCDGTRTLTKFPSDWCYAQENK